MSNVVHDIDSVHTLLAQNVDRVALLFAEDRDQDTTTGNFLPTRRIHMEHGALYNTLETQGGLGILVLDVGRNQGRCGVQKFCKFLTQRVCACTTSAHHLSCLSIIEQSKQQVLDAHQLMALLPCVLVGKVQCYFQVSA